MTKFDLTGDEVQMLVDGLATEIDLAEAYLVNSQIDESMFPPSGVYKWLKEDRIPKLKELKKKLEVHVR